MARSSDRLTDTAARALIGAAMRLPYERRVTFMGRAMRSAVGPLAGWRRRARANLAMIRPDLTPAMRARIAQAALDNMGRTLIETWSGAELTARAQAGLADGEGLAAFEALRRAGRPVLLVTGHFGNHEAPRHALTARGHAIGGLYRPMRNARFDAAYVETLRHSGPIFPQGKRGLTGLVRHLREGGAGMLLFDAWARGGVPIPFLGREAATSLAVGQVARRTGAAVVPVWGVRARDGLSFDIRIDPPLPEAEPEATLRTLTARLEELVAQNPGQWLWSHRRWKREGAARDSATGA
ncbi:MAG: lysophospholipid acyltransferase family protein [Paracoccaceae bacterium]